MKYGVDDIKKTQEVIGFIEDRAKKVNEVFQRTWREMDGRHKVIYDGSIDYIIEIQPNLIIFSTVDTCMGQAFYDSCEIPMKYFVSDDYEEMLKRDIRNDFEDEKREKAKEQEELAIRMVEAQKKAEEEEYETYLSLKEKYEPGKKAI